MIRADKSGPLGWLAAAYVGRKVRSAFRGLWVRGEVPRGEGGLLVYVNHTNWWDGFAVHQLGAWAGWDAYALMDEVNLARYPFLRRIGAFSIRRGDAQSSLETFRYARGLLRRPRAAVFVFPEGEHRPFGELPPRLQPGLAVLARAAGAPACVPVALRYAFLEHERPELLVEVGAAHPPCAPGEYAERLGAVVARLAAATELAGFTCARTGARGVAERWDALRGRRQGAAP